MEANLMLEQYGRYKKPELENSPYRCLLNANIELNPHQINAFIAAVHALKTGGIVLADEVGLGKTIEAGLVLKYVLDSGAQRVIIALPATLRKQWEIELDEKFGLTARILDRYTVDHDYYEIKNWIENPLVPRIVIASYDYASKFMKRFSKVKWDFLIVDEAHHLRNVFHGTKRAKNLYELSKGIPKILLTATPLQNDLTDLHGLISFIDPRIFGNEDMFMLRYVYRKNYQELKEALIPVLYRTLRKDVGKYMNFKKRECRTIDFALSMEEGALYAKVNAFLKRPVLYSIPTKTGGLITLVIRKLLASSSFALVETFEVLKERLEKLYEGTRSADAQEGFDLFWEYVEDEIDEDDSDEAEPEDIQIQKQQISDEIDEVESIIELAGSIKQNAKIEALKKALSTAFTYQEEQGIPQKVVVFTESKRTQKYIAAELRKDGYLEEDILLFNGSFDDPMAKEIYRAWQVKNYGNVNYGKSVEFKHAIVEYFKDNAKVLIVTDAGSEGLNLQFCNTVINYDLPWNPQKIEQRIGRCHRYGQTHDVVAINLLNTQNEADRRVYDILSRKFELFDGVFGASDIALGALESGASFEKIILEIYQKCNTPGEFKREFDKLDRKLEARRDKKAQQLRTLLLTESADAKGAALEKTKQEIDHYLRDVEYWAQVAEPEFDGKRQYWRIDNWGEANFGSHGTLFLGAFVDLNKASKPLFPVLFLCDENGEYIDFNEDEIISALEKADDQDIRNYTPTEEDKKEYDRIFDRLTEEMLVRYRKSIEPMKAYNKQKIENWADIQTEQLNQQIEDMHYDAEQLIKQASNAKDFLEKIDIKKKAAEKVNQLERFQTSFHEKVSAIQEEAAKEIAEFDKQFEIKPFLFINIVLKF